MIVNNLATFSDLRMAAEVSDQDIDDAVNAVLPDLDLATEACSLAKG